MAANRTFFYAPNLLILFVVCSTYSITSLRFQYVVLGLMVPLALLTRVPQYRPSFTRFGALRLSSWLLFLAWIYGVCSGLLHGVDPVLVFSNFAGMSLYLFLSFFLLVFQPNYLQVEYSIKTAAKIYFFVAFFGFFSFSPSERGNISELGLTYFRFYYSVGTFIFFPYLCINLFSLFYTDYSFNRLGKASLAFLFLFTTGSKGIYLALAFIALVFLAAASRMVLRGTGKSTIFIFVLIASLGGAAIIYSFPEFSEALMTSIRLEASSSNPRVIQSDALVSEFSLLGSGLGAPLESGYARDKLGYGFELTYHNIIHKLGYLVGGLVVMLLLLPLLWSVRETIRRPSGKGPVCLGLTSYLFVGYGNPALFAPISVLFAVLSLYLMDRSVGATR